MRAAAGVMLVCLAAGCRPHPPAAEDGATPPAPAANQAPHPAADSIVLERTRCFGLCPAYRLSIARSGAVHFESRNPGDSTRAVSTTPSPGAFEALVRQAEALRFWSLPDQIAGSALCKQRATDHPGAATTIFGRGGSKRVDDYLGCFDAPQALRRFETAIDSAAGSARWVRPAAVR